MSNTNEDIRDDLDNYGGHLPVYVEDLNGHLRLVDEIGSRTLSDGMAIIITLGPIVQL